MDKQYITKTDLATRWSNSLIEKYYPQCSEKRVNSHHKRASPMQLYDVGKVDILNPEMISRLTTKRC